MSSILGPQHPPKRRPELQSKQGSFGFQVGKYTVRHMDPINAKTDSHFANSFQKMTS